MILYFQVKWFLYKEERQIGRRFPAFKPYLRAFKKAYRFRNPYRICKRYLQQRGEKDVHAYGETPLTILAQIAHLCGLNKEDNVYELGCGRGKGAFFLSHLTGCRVTGVDWVPFFIHTAKTLAESTSLPLTFQCEEMQKIDFSSATLIYLYGTCLPDAVIEELMEKFPLSARIVTVSFPLSDYSPRFRVLKQFSAQFPWGETDIYINGAAV